MANRLNEQRIDFLKDLKAGSWLYFLPQYAWWRFLAVILCCAFPFTLLIFNAPAGPVFGLWVVLMILFGLHCVYGKDAEITDNGLTIYTFRRRKISFSWKDLKRTTRLKANVFRVKNQEGEDFEINLSSLTFFAEQSLFLFRDILNEYADRNGNKADWKPQVRLPNWDLGDEWYRVTYDLNWIRAFRIATIGFTLLSACLLAFFISQKMFSITIFWCIGYILDGAWRLLKFRKLKELMSLVEFRFPEGKDVIVRYNQLEYEVAWEETEWVIPDSIQFSAYSKNPIPFEYGWSWTAPDGKKIIFDPRFIAPSDQTQSDPFRASVPANA